jgi:hypothetical protein
MSSCRTRPPARLSVDVRPIDAADAARFQPRAIEVIESTRITEPAPIRQISAISSHAVFDAIVAAIAEAKRGEVSGIVTAPINKEAMASAGVRYPGHTDRCAATARCDGINRRSAGVLYRNRARPPAQRHGRGRSAEARRSRRPDAALQHDCLFLGEQPPKQLAAGHARTAGAIKDSTSPFALYREPIQPT